MNANVGKLSGSIKARWAWWQSCKEKASRQVRHLLQERLRIAQMGWVPSLLNPRRGVRFLAPGALLVVITCLMGMAAINTNTGLLYWLVGLLIGMWLVSGVFSSINLRGLTIMRQVSGTSQVGEKLIITYTITNHKRFFCSYGLMLEELGRLPMSLPAGLVMQVKPGEQRRCCVEITCRRRGYIRLRRIRVSSRFPFGLVGKCFLATEGNDVVVHPALGHIKFERLPNQTSSASGALGQYNQQTKGFEEFFGLREFHNYDNYHWIHWRSSAKLDRLMVKEMAEYNANRLTVVVDCRLEDMLSLEQQNLLEEAISFAATLIDRATQRCLPVAMVVCGRETRIIKHGRGTSHRWSLMTELSDAQMSVWDYDYPDTSSLVPLSFIDSHQAIIGVGVSSHAGRLRRRGHEITVVDPTQESFNSLFQSGYRDAVSVYVERMR